MTTNNPEKGNAMSRFNAVRLTSLLTAAVVALSTTVAGAASAMMPPDQMVKATQAALQPQINSRADEFTRDPNKLYQFVNDGILPHFDFNYISQLVLGQAWRTASDMQKQRFTAAFENMLVRTYAHALLEYRNQKIEWEPLKMSSGDTDATVETKVLRDNGPPVPMDYRLHVQGGEWKVYDVVIDAVSLVTNYRGSFASEVRQHGLDSLIARLEAKQTASSAASAPAN
jgi:phospholipid transport system substrate-binding protein